MRDARSPDRSPDRSCAAAQVNLHNRILWATCVPDPIKRCISELLALELLDWSDLLEDGNLFWEVGTRAPSPHRADRPSRASCAAHTGLEPRSSALWGRSASASVGPSSSAGARPSAPSCA